MARVRPLPSASRHSWPPPLLPPSANLPTLPPTLVSPISAAPQGCTHALKLRDSFKLGPQLQLELGADLLLPSTGTATDRTATSHGEAAPNTITAGGGAAASNSVSSLTAADSASGLAASGGSAVAATGPPPAAERVPPAAAAPTAGALRFAGPWVALQWQVDLEDRSKGVVRADAHHVSYSRHFRLGRKADWWAVPLDAKLGLTYSGGLLNKCPLCVVLPLSAKSIGSRIMGAFQLWMSPTHALLMQAGRAWRWALPMSLWRWGWRPPCWSPASPCT